MNDKLRPAIQKIIDEIAKTNMLKTEGVGEAGVRTAQWERFEQLKKEATLQEIKYLTDYPNAVVRGYAFWALVEQDSAEVFSVLQQHLSDNEKLSVFEGCLISQYYVGEYFLNKASHHLNAAQKAEIDSALLFKEAIILPQKYALLEKLKPKQAYYNRIKEIAQTEKKPEALLALSRFKNKEDIPLVSTLFDTEDSEYNGLRAAIAFPDTAFYPFLIKVFEREWAKVFYNYKKWKALYQALALQKPSEKIVTLFERAIKTKDDFRYQILGEYLLLGITKYPNALYEPLKTQIKLDEHHLRDLKYELEQEE
ncbi:MAG: hypothetical protein JST67_06480 [Bacteroidetes bacterium]|nr:hypothetical protein [Bacteroidota bacterium]